MPLLRKKEFQKSTIPELLRDDEEVFHCVVTNEIFRDYDEFCQRIILVNSMVWSCAMTGKSNLTYAEALQSEHTAKKSLKDFPMELRIPVLFLASKTKRSAFGEMAEDVFAFVKDRYFVGENIESCFTENNWRDAYVLQVIAPSAEQIETFNKTNNKTNERNFSPPASLFRYEVEQLDANDQDSSQVMIVEAGHVRRKKGPFTKERLRLFLKQFVELKDTGIICIKESVKRKYKFENVRFDQLFDGPMPEFEQTKKVVNNGKVKKVRQESIASFLRKGPTATNGAANANGKLFMEEMKRKEAEYKQKLEEMKQKRVEEKLLERQRRKEESIKIASLVRDWNKPRDDLLLENQKPLPNPSQVQTKIPSKYFGDALMILEFVNSFSTIVSVKDFFPGGLTFDLVERALTENEVAGPLTDIIQMLLTAIFNIQNVEATETKNTQMDINSDHVPLQKQVRLSTMASNWSLVYQGVSLNHLPLYPVTVSEILRLHLMGSGAQTKESVARWRYQQRGGYTNEDDPGLMFRQQNAHILKTLTIHNVNELPMEDKLKILICLVDQLLTYADVRDAIEERIERAKSSKSELKTALIHEKKIESDFVKMKKDKDDSGKVQEELEKMQNEMKRKRSSIQHKITSAIKTLVDNHPSLGMDRSFQKYIKIDSIPAFFVENDEQFPGCCLDRIITQKPELIDAGQEETMNYVKQLNEENSSSDKENDNGLKKTPKKVNGARNSVDIVSTRNLQMCTANNHPCPVHSNTKQPSWGFYHDKDDIQTLINCLNKRGVRESELRETLELNKEHLEKIITDSYPPQLNPTIKIDDEIRDRYNSRKIPKSLRYENSHLGFPTELDVQEVLSLSLVDSILELEEKIHLGSLGQLKVKDREAWRKHLENRCFDKIDKTLVKREDASQQLDKIKAEGKNNNSRPNTPDQQQQPQGIVYKDAAKYLKAAYEINDSDEEEDNEEDSKEKVKVNALAIALLQVAQAVEFKHLMKPLGTAEKSKTKTKSNVLSNWERSLMSSTNYGQVFLHYSTLDNCIMWKRSVLMARCQVCRRTGDAENMLLCDSCNQGYHIYCLKPKLISIPKGDWFCHKCNPEQLPERAARKTRKIFKEEEEDEDDDEDEDEDEVENEEDYNNEDDDEENEDVEEEEKNDTKAEALLEVCEECGSGGRVICCDYCPKVYHLECTQPVLRRVPRGEWKCHRCRHNKSNKKQDNNRDIKQEDTQVNGERTSRNRQKNSNKKADMTYDDDDDDDEDEEEEDEKDENVRGKSRSRQRNSNKYTKDESDSGSGEEYTQQRRSTRRAHDSKGGDGDLPLNNAALQELLADVMKHKDAWPFTRPVTKQEVPDYFDVIKTPMDFGTIKYKLNMGEYHHDAQVMLESALVFENCDTYNHSEADVYKCGIRLLKYFEKRAHDLGFNFPKNVMGPVEETQTIKKQVKDDDDDGPTAPKRSRN